MQESFGDYRVLEWAGAGTSAEVFRARDTRRGHTVAIKVLISDLAMDPVQGPLFVAEALLAADLSHPNVAALHEIGERDGRPYLVFEFVQGQTLSALLAGRPLNSRRAVDFAVQIADALAYAHATGLVHRVLRPDKIIVTLKGTAKTIDLGLGQYAMAVMRGQAASGAAVPPMAYWAPEQKGGAAGDHRVDIHALGLVLLEMLTGRPPSAQGEAPPMEGIARDIQSIITRLIATTPDRRYDSAALAAADLRSVATELDARREAGRSPVARTRLRGSLSPGRTPAKGRSRGLLILLALVVTIALIWLAARS